MQKRATRDNEKNALRSEEQSKPGNPRYTVIDRHRDRVDVVFRT